MYTLQPPEAFICNPYLNGILNLTCAVTGEPVKGIQWYFRRPNSVKNIMLTNESSNVTLIPNSIDNYYSLNLVISDLNSNNEGFYWCQGLVLEGDYILELTNSHEFELLPQFRYISLPCPIDKAIKNTNVRCAAIIPLSTDPPIVSSSVPYPDQVTSSDILVPLDPTSSVEETHITSTQIITPSLSTPQMPASQPTIATSDEPTPPMSSLQLTDIILYSILALLGFLTLLVLSLSIGISVLCCRKRRTGLEGKYHQHLFHFYIVTSIVHVISLQNVFKGKLTFICPFHVLFLKYLNTSTDKSAHSQPHSASVPSGVHKRREAAPRSVQHRMIAWNNDVLATAARLCPYSDRS